MFKMLVMIGIVGASVPAFANLDCAPLTNTPTPPKIEVFISNSTPEPYATVKKGDKIVGIYKVERTSDAFGYIDIQGGRFFQLYKNDVQDQLQVRMKAWNSQEGYFIKSPYMVCSGEL